MNSKALVSGADVACRSRGEKENSVYQNSQQISHIGTANIQKSADSTKIMLFKTQLGSKIRDYDTL